MQELTGSNKDHCSNETAKPIINFLPDDDRKVIDFEMFTDFLKGSFELGLCMYEDEEIPINENLQTMIYFLNTQKSLYNNGNIASCINDMQLPLEGLLVELGLNDEEANDVDLPEYEPF